MFFPPWPLLVLIVSSKSQLSYLSNLSLSSSNTTSSHHHSLPSDSHRRLSQGDNRKSRPSGNDVTSLNSWVVRDYHRLVNSVNSSEPHLQKLSDEQLTAKTAEFRWRLGRGETLADIQAGITEEDLLKSLAQSLELNSNDIDDIQLPNLPRPPNAFRGIRKKNSSLKRWLAICSDDLTKNGRYRATTNLLRKYLGDILIASYLDVVQDSGYDDTYVKEVEVNVRSFGHRNSLKEYKIDGCRFFISMLSAT